MIKGTHRINGFITTMSCGSPVRNAVLNSYYSSTSLETHDILNESEASNVNSTFDSESLGLEDSKYFQIKDEPQDDFENKTNIHSIIGLGQDCNSSKNLKLTKPRLKRPNVRGTHHETLQRIDSSYDLFNHYQRHWFSTGLEKLKLEDRSREERLEITRYELRRHLKQILRSNVGHTNNLPDIYTEEYIITSRSTPSGYDRLVAPRMCDISNCKRAALACTRYCTRHIMHNKDQVLFSYCTAKFADNTQCSVPVFDITHELPLCREHARKRDNYKMYQETKPKKLRKKVKPSAMIRPQKRNKKKKKPVNKPTELDSCNIVDSTVIPNEMTDVQDDSSELAEDMVEQVLALQEPDVLELPPDDQVLVSQAGHLLEESDITNVLNTIQAHEFNDFFTVNRNGEYEPTKEETEELERALAAVDNDVKSLEKLSQSQGLLDSLLDEHTLVESLVQIPDMFHNGYGTCGDSMVVGQTSRLLPVEPHSQH